MGNICGSPFHLRIPKGKRVLLRLIFSTTICFWTYFIWICLRSPIDHLGIYSPHTKATYCRWPPRHVDEILTQNNTYNITLCIRTNANTSRSGIPKYNLTDIFRINNASNSEISFEELSKIKRRFWKYARYPTIYSTYPQDVPIYQIIASIKSGSPVSVVSCHVIFTYTFIK